MINNQVDQATGTITLKAVFPNQDQALWPGQFVNAHLLLDTVRNGTTVPPGAVQMGPKGPFVYVIKPDQTVEARQASVTQVEDGKALIGKGLGAGAARAPCRTTARWSWQTAIRRRPESTKTPPSRRSMALAVYYIAF